MLEIEVLDLAFSTDMVVENEKGSGRREEEEEGGGREEGRVCGCREERNEGRSILCGF